jgi:hypothetical protein
VFSGLSTSLGSISSLLKKGNTILDNVVFHSMEKVWK